MSWFNKQTDNAYYDLLLNECSKEKEELEDHIRELENKITSLEQKYTQTKTNAYANIENESFIFDFNTLTPFSIERVLDENGILITCIGYFSHRKNKSVAREWYIRCSAEKHKKIINEFKAFIINRDCRLFQNVFEHLEDEND